MEIIEFDERRARTTQEEATYWVEVRTDTHSSNPSVFSNLLLGAQFDQALEWAREQVADGDTDARLYLLPHAWNEDIAQAPRVHAIYLTTVPPLRTS